MTNDKCPMINERGYALIAMVFILVSFISVVFLVSYPLIKEARDETGSYIADRNDYRFRKALFGEMVDQCCTKLAHCGGFFSDYTWSGAFDTGKRYHHHKVIARIFGVMGRTGTATIEIKIPENYKYKDTFWQGYQGKRYLHILPSDKWDYNTYYDVIMMPNGMYKENTPYNPFFQPYARIFIDNVCGGTASLQNSARMELGSCTGYDYKGGGSRHIGVKDYSRNKNNPGHKLRLVSIGSINKSHHSSSYEQETIYFECEKDATNPDYVLYRCNQCGVDWLSRNTAHSGQKKLMIQVSEDGGPWVTMDTRLLVYPPDISFDDRIPSSDGNSTYRLKKGLYTGVSVNFYG